MTRTIRPLGLDDLDDLIRIRRTAFPSPGPLDLDTARERMRPRLPWIRGLFDDGRLATVATWFPYRAWIGGVRRETGALAGVASSPETRRRGHVRALVADGLEGLHERGIGFALEHPFDPAFYEAMGFRSVPGAVALDLPIERIAGDAKDVEFEAVDVASSSGRAAHGRMLDVHAAFARRWTFGLDRDWRPGGEEPGRGPQWRRALASDGAEDPNAYVTEGGYAVVSVRPKDGSTTLEVLDLGWTDADARLRVLAILGAWRGQAARVEVDLPVSDPVARDEAMRHAVRRPTLQARIVDLPGAISPLRAPAGTGGTVRTIRVIDPLCPWNEDTWRVLPGPEGTAVERSAGSAEAVLDVRALVSLLTGTPPAVLLANGEAEGDAEALRDLARLTSDHPPYLSIADYF